MWRVDVLEVQANTSVLSSQLHKEKTLWLVTHHEISFKTTKKLSKIHMTLLY